MNLKTLRRFFLEHHKRPKKSLSQNFLIDQNIVAKMLNLAQVAPGDRILEIGAGAGIITEKLLEQGAEVTAVELDSTFAQALRRFPTLKVIEGDILKVPLPPFDKVISNLPYHITAPILSRLLPLPFSTMTLFVQEEVARRMAASPNKKVYGAFSLFVQFYAQPTYAFRVARHCFYPAPKVDSAVVHLVKTAPPPVDPDAFFPFVHTAFQGRRKRVATTLGKKYRLHIEGSARPENLSLEDFLTYYAQIPRPQ